MKKQDLKVQYVTGIVLAVMLVLSLIASVTKIFTGFDIDEAYALAIPYRVLQGDRLFADMWEVHQTSFFLPYVIMKAYEVMTGSMDGVVIFTRVITTLLHLSVSLLVYKTIRSMDGKGNKKTAVLLGLLYFNFLPKWMINLDFSMMQLWFFTLFILCFWKACFLPKDKRESFVNLAKIKKQQVIWIVIAGVMLSLDVLAYPGMVAVYVVAVILLFVRKDERWKKILGLTAGCGIVALVFFIGILSAMSLSELIEAIPKVFMDGSHQYDTMTKLRLYASQWGEVLVQSVILLLPTALGTAVIWKFYKDKGMTKRYGELPFGLLFCVFFEILVSGIIAFAYLVVTWGPFRLQVRYIIQFVMAFVLWHQMNKSQKGTGVRTHSADTVFLQKVGMVLWLSLGAFVGILLASNVGPVSSASYLVLGNLVFCALAWKLANRKGTAMKNLAAIGTVLFVLSLMMCKGYYMRNTEYVSGDISTPMAKVEEGPLAGVYVPVADHKRYTSDYETIQTHTKETDKVLFMGTEGLCNLYAKGKIVIPTTISTPAFNEQWVEYFELYPEKQPTVIFIAKNTIDNREKFFSKNVFGIWIASRYDIEGMEETESLCILRSQN